MVRARRLVCTELFPYNRSPKSLVIGRKVLLTKPTQFIYRKKKERKEITCVYFFPSSGGPYMRV